MQHVYFQQYHDPNDEPSAEPIDIDIDGDNDFTIDHWRQLIWGEIEDFKNEHPDLNFKPDIVVESDDSLTELEKEKEKPDTSKNNQIIDKKEENISNSDNSNPVTPSK